MGTLTHKKSTIDWDTLIPFGLSFHAHSNAKPIPHIHAISLDEVLSKNPQYTTFMWAFQDRPNDGIFCDDLLIIDRSLYPSPNDLVILTTQTRFDICRWQTEPSQNNAPVGMVWGVICHSIRSFRH